MDLIQGFLLSELTHSLVGNLIPELGWLALSGKGHQFFCLISFVAKDMNIISILEKVSGARENIPRLFITF